MTILKELIRKTIHPFYKRYHFWYHKKPRKYFYKNVYTIIQPTVFSPKNTLSTKFVLEFLNGIDLENKKVLELGCGSGIISLFLASKNAKVVASDINEIAINSLKKVSKEQNLKIDCVVSDLFKDISMSNRAESRFFDYIIINPPYYPKKPKNIEEQAWFCGDDFEYFERLFLELNSKIERINNILMVLSTDCDLFRIKEIASKNNLEFKHVKSRKFFFETNSIFKISHKKSR